MKSVLITGAGGLIGSRVAEAARKADYAVTRIFHKAALPEAANVLERDLRLPLEEVPPVDSIFHLAGGCREAGAGAHRPSDSPERNPLGCQSRCKELGFCQCGRSVR